MGEKKADNIISEYKQDAKEIEDLIDIEKNKINKINDIEQNAVNINKIMNDCIDILSVSVVGEKSNNIYNDMYNRNRQILNKISSITSEETARHKKKLNDLYSQQTKREKEYKKEYKKEG